ncbi:MAG: ferritin-like domain-containing protein [Gammaproteobacteria bacterium]|nr:ferritin-like domain-containing protein [Gammaproteobacteria bacterium]
MISENERWILSFYRTSEISGSLFFGRLARSLKPGPIQHDMTRHYADEAMHAWYWTECMAKLGVEPIEPEQAYQDQYLAAAGMPVNLMEILAITQVFERRVINQYAVHARAEGIDPIVRGTIERIVEDEKWHIRWIRDALRDMEPEYGKQTIDDTIERFLRADREVYEKTVREHEERVGALGRE